MREPHTTLTQSGIQLIRGVMLGGLLLALSVCGLAQGGFVSGSTGADGAFNPTTSQTVQLPESGVFNFTTITIPTGVTITFQKNSRNTSVIMLATGDVVIRGILYMNGTSSTGAYGAAGGPGGFRGGNAGWPFEHPDGFPGEGPGGGLGGRRGQDGSASDGGSAGYRFNGTTAGGPLQGAGGQSYGNANVSLLIGGSGGGGRSANLASSGTGGGGGGGAILIASSTQIRFEGGELYAYGGNAFNTSGLFQDYHGGAGAGGSIRLIANTIQGSPALSVLGGCGGGGCGARGSLGYIRAEAFDLTQFTPANNDFSRGLPSPAILPNPPSLRIASVGGVNAPANPAASFAANPDITVPTTVTNPVTVSIQASNIPLGTVVQITQTTDANAKTTANSTPLAGTTANSTATASVTLPASGMSVLTATATLNALVAFGRPIHINGERVDKVEIASAFGNQPKITYITATGRRVKWPE